MTPERLCRLMAQFGFDQPIWKQYLDYVGELLHGDFGYSFSTKQPVLDEFSALFPATLELVALRDHLRHRPRHPRRASSPPSGAAAGSTSRLMGTALIGYSMPIFWWGLLLIIFFSAILGWTPVSGRIALISSSSSRSPASC